MDVLCFLCLVPWTMRHGFVEFIGICRCLFVRILNVFTLIDLPSRSVEGCGLSSDAVSRRCSKIDTTRG
jgi:hypothetical protein